MAEILCTQFNTEDGKRQHFWHIILYYFKKGKNATENLKKICVGYGKNAVTDQTCQKWFVKFLGTVNILAKQFFAVGLSYALEDV